MNIELLVCLKVQREKFYIEDHCDTDHIFALVRSGSFSVNTGSQTFTVAPFEGMLFRAGQRYIRQIISPVKMFLFRYKADSIHFSGEHIVFRDTARVRSTIDLLEKLDKQTNTKELSLQRHLLIDLMMLQQVESAPAMPTDSRVEATINHIHSNISSKLAIPELAEIAGLSYAQYFRVFKECTGTTPTEYILMQRMQVARQLLTNTSLPIKEIALASGFENEFYFSNVFKRQNAISPSSFRKQAQ